MMSNNIDPALNTTGSQGSFRSLVRLARAGEQGTITAAAKPPLQRQGQRCDERLPPRVPIHQ
eukprot:COSAG02_NODE_43832_length_371_cov_0.889706_1_plen_61_part_10